MKSYGKGIAPVPNTQKNFIDPYCGQLYRPSTRNTFTIPQNTSIWSQAEYPEYELHVDEYVYPGWPVLPLLQYTSFRKSESCQ